MLAIRLMCMAGLLATNAYALTFTTESSPPYNFSKDNGKTIVGSATEVVQEMLKRTGMQATISLYPWERAYKMGLDEKDTCVYSTTRTEEREKLFKWVGPLATNNWTLFAKADSKLALSKLEDAMPYKIGGYQGDAKAVFLKDKGYKLEETISDTQNVQKLEAGRIDLWASGSQDGPYIASQQNIKIKPLLSFKDAQLYLACNKSIPDDQIAKMNAAIAAMAKDGTVENIVKKYR